MYEKIKPAIALFIITAIAAVALGMVYDVTKAPIAEQKARDIADTVAMLIPGADETEVLDVALESSSVTQVITCRQAGEVVGYAIMAAPKGYSGAVELMVGFDLSGMVQGVQILSHAETPGLGANAALPAFTNQFKGKTGRLVVTKINSSQPNEVEAVTSATITSNAVADGVNDATDYFEQMQR